MEIVQALKQPLWALKRTLLHHREREGDRRFGIDTEVATFNAAPDLERSPYEPVHYAALEIIDARIPLGGADVFYDLGCGKGRVLCHFARKPIRKAVGVEYDPELAELAAENVRTLAARRAETSVIVGDAAAQDYSDATLIFMFNPFGADTMRRVLGRVSGRSALRIVYAGPVQAPVFAEFPALRVIDEFRVPYDLGRMSVVTWRHD